MQMSNEQMGKISETMMQAYTEMNSMMHDTMNAALQSMSIMTKGCGDLCDSMSSLMQKSMEQSMKVSQTMMSGTSVGDLMNPQNNMMKSSFDNLMGEMTNISQLSTRIAQEAAEPMKKQMTETMSKMSKMKAA